jgi:hypothetical protein
MRNFDRDTHVIMSNEGRQQKHSQLELAVLSTWIAPGEDCVSKLNNSPLRDDGGGYDNESAAVLHVVHVRGCRQVAAWRTRGKGRA